MQCNYKNTISEIVCIKKNDINSSSREIPRKLREWKCAAKHSFDARLSSRETFPRITQFNLNCSRALKDVENSFWEKYRITAFIW